MPPLNKFARKVPSRAFAFDATEVDIKKCENSEEETPKPEGENKLAEGDPPAEEDPKPAETPSGFSAPLTIIARTGAAVTHWFWGTMVHDFAGMTVKGPIPVDYCHDCNQVLGVSESADAASGELVLSAKLISTQPNDRAAEVYTKANAGVPYQASITMGWDNLVTEDVPAGNSTMVNGQEVPGPVTVFRQWELRGVAICPLGTDGDTSVQFAPKGDAEYDVTTFRLASPSTPVAKSGPEYLTAFGPQGGVWFAEGKSWDDAQRLFSQQTQAEIAALKKTNTELQAAVTKLKGADPVSFQPETPPTSAAPSDPRLQHALPQGLQRLAAANASVMRPAAK